MSLHGINDVLNGVPFGVRTLEFGIALRVRFPDCGANRREDLVRRRWRYSNDPQAVLLDARRKVGAKPQNQKEVFRPPAVRDIRKNVLHADDIEPIECCLRWPYYVDRHHMTLAESAFQRTNKCTREAS
jgi:hypothetical protein